MRGLLRETRATHVVRVRQSPEAGLEHPNVVSRAPFRTQVIDLSKGLEDLYGELDSKSCRYEIRRAEKQSDHIDIARNDGRAIEAFRVLYRDFVRLKGHSHPISGRRLGEWLRVSDVFVLSLDGKPNCGHLVLRDRSEGRARLVLSASRRLASAPESHSSGSMNRYLHWHEIVTYKNEGFRLYDFGGLGEETIDRFKRSFGGIEVTEWDYLILGRLGFLGYRLYQMSRAVRLRVGR